MKSRCISMFLVFIICFALPLAAVSDLKPKPKPVKVFVLAGQSNMEGQAVVDLTGPDYNAGKGTIVALLNDPAKAAFINQIKGMSTSWPSRDNVWVRYKREAGPMLAGPLGFGYSVYGDKHHFGPELQFGHVVGGASSEQVLLIKTAWGGKSLFKDFRPPSSGGEVGPYYTKMIAEIREALTNLRTDFPSYAGQGYQLSGFVWYQGWNDGVDPKQAIPEYEQNLVNFIKDVRRELKVPKLPVVVGELTGPWVAAPREWTALRQAQKRATERPEFNGNVTFVETHDFVRKPEDSPNPGHGHHEFGNAETYLLVGDALGKGMLRLLRAPQKAAYHDQRVEGWTVRINSAYLESNKAHIDTALKLMRSQLRDIVRVVPAGPVKRLREVILWINPEYTGIGPHAEYHPGADWLVENGRNPDMVKGVEFTDIRIFQEDVNRMPWFVLHELAHSYHDRVLGFGNPEVAAAYAKAKESKSYDHVERWFGNGRRNTYEKAYAMTNPQEYFAESSEAFFGRNDFYPFTREELKKHDPEMEQLLIKLWGSSTD